MVDVILLRNVIGIIGNFISFGLFLAPMPTFITILKKKAVEQFSPLPYIATLLNCALWVFYGTPLVSSGNTLIWTINGVGFILESLYLIIFFHYSQWDNRKKILVYVAGEVAFMSLVIGVVVGLAHPGHTRTLIVGILCVIFGTLMYGSPLSVMKMVIETKSVKYMPFTLSFVSFVNGCCWLTYALLKFDIFVVIPNGMGALLGLAQLILYATFYSSTPKERKGEVQMYGAAAVAPPGGV